MTIIIKILSILVLTVSLLGGATGAAFAAESGPTPYDDALLALINQARQNPLGVAASMGMDPEKILQDLPGLEKILRDGLPPVVLNGNLYEAARAHTQDMFANNFYSHLSPDGRGYDARIKDAGYPAAVTGESLGMLAFANFIDPKDAARFLFEYMFWDELDPLRKEKRNILDPWLKEVGVSVDTGVLSLGGVQWNVYLATSDFGAVISGPEAGLLHLINQTRENPLAAAAALGMDPQQILADLPELRDILTQGLPPLTFSGDLYRAARAHAEDMLAKGYYSPDSSDGRTYVDRIRETGYNPLEAGEYMGLQCLGTDPVEAVNDKVDWIARRIFEMYFIRELRPNSTERRIILNADLKDVGISLVMGTSNELGGICGDFVLLMVADFGLSVP
ncbi:MAG: CAP domain-containing protein [Syntrophales bacterium]